MSKLFCGIQKKICGLNYEVNKNQVSNKAMTTNSSKSQKTSGLDQKPERLQTESEAIEPHEIAGSMTPSQIKVFAAELANLMAKK